jgi:hypothetical protein
LSDSDKERFLNPSRADIFSNAHKQTKITTIEEKQKGQQHNLTIMFRGDYHEENWSAFHSRHSGDYFSQATQRNILFDRVDDRDHPKRRGCFLGIFWTLLSCTSAEAAVVIGGPPAASASAEAKKKLSHSHHHRTTSTLSTRSSSIASASTYHRHHRRRPSVQERRNGSLRWQHSPLSVQERYGTLQ